MSITNYINDDNLTIIQGVNGICLYEESWMKKTTNSHPPIPKNED